MDDEPETTFESGDVVFVIDHSFDPVIKRGRIGTNDSADSGRGIDVLFDHDPRNPDQEIKRPVIVDPDQMVHVDADKAEVYRFIGIEHLLEDDENPFEDGGTVC